MSTAKMRGLRLACAVALACISAPAFTAQPGMLVVDSAAAPGGDGSERFPFRDLQDAVSAASAASEAVKRSTTETERWHTPGSIIPCPIHLWARARVMRHTSCSETR